ISYLVKNSPKSNVYKIDDSSDKPGNRLNAKSSVKTVKPAYVGDKSYKQCQSCGAIERTNDERCPICGAPYNDKNKKK
ncbi:MAG: hypothetical protein K2M64_03370, partial [Clostridia bacterium]|nr:hypothetical protein [Clostridia bacterium]